MLQSSSSSSEAVTTTDRGVSLHHGEEFQFRLVSTREELEQCQRLRHAIFVQEQKVPREAEVDGKDHQAFHIVCYESAPPDTGNASGESSSSSSPLVATGRVLIVPYTINDNNGNLDTAQVSSKDSPNQAILGRIAVRQDHRGKGLGRRIVQELERIARSEGAVRASLTPHYYLERFYASLGYIKTPPSTDGPNGNHNDLIWINEHCQLIAMEKSLL
jgi:predicted GNAT family N-acyltransferase